MGEIDDEERLEPMPLLPTPQAHPNITLPSPHPHSAPLDVGEHLTPESPPIPHTHPLVALSDESARNVKIECEKGGMANTTSQRLFHHRTIITGKRLDPTFLSRDRLQAFADRHEDAPQQSVNSLAHETEHSSHVIALQLQEQREEMENMRVSISLGEQERTIAATEASDRRYELLVSGSNWSNKDAVDDESAVNGRSGSALARASEKLVKKQVSAKWAQSRQDPTRRPKGPLERLEEQHLRETLFRMTAHDLLRSGVLYEEADAVRNATFKQINRLQLPLVTNGSVGLEGSIFEE